MNKSNWEHVGLSLLMQSVLMLPCHLILNLPIWVGMLVGGAFASGFFGGREHAQREYQITRGGPVGNLKGWEGFLGWTGDSNRDFYPSVVAVSLVTGLSYLVF